jgi:phosphate transport system protein
MNQIRHFDLELADLKRSLVSMGNMVERSLSIAVEAIIRPTVEAREQCRVLEEQLDTLETAIEDRCHQIIALQQPMAGELRLVIAAMRITADLEQVGDLAESVAKRASFIARNKGATIPAQIETLGRLTLGMQRHAMEAFITGNLNLARGVITDEDHSDTLTKQCYEQLQGLMRDDSDRIREYTHLLRAASQLEHIADVAVSIAEETVYIYKGLNIRHHHEDLTDENP